MEVGHRIEAVAVGKEISVPTQRPPSIFDVNHGPNYIRSCLTWAVLYLPSSKQI